MNTYFVQPTIKGLIRGFTLTELLISISVILIVTGLIMPSAQLMLERHRIAADINQISALVRFARTHAISEFSDVTLCPSRDMNRCERQWQHGLMVFVDSNQNQQLDTDERLLASSQGLAKSHKIKGPRSTITFYHTGSSASPASLLLCNHNNKNILARGIYLSLQGRVRLTKDSNDDGIHESTPGNNINCTNI